MRIVAPATFALVLSSISATAGEDPFTAVQPGPSGAQLKVEPVARGLVHPWAVAFLPEGRFLVTERPGRMRIVEANGRVGPALAGLPKVDAGGQGGLLDVIADRDVERSRRIFFCYSEPSEDGRTNSTALASATVAAGARALEHVQVLFRQQPKVASRLHFGCRIVQAPDGSLFLALGERFTRKRDAQRLDNHLGKVVRIAPSGGPAKGNPLADRPGALAEIWSWGHRNPQGAAWGPDDRLWIHEHGPQGGDEVNVVHAGRNYGWPVVTYGEEYGGGAVGEGTHRPGMEQPAHYWVPSIAPSGMAFLSSDRYGASWRGSLFVGALKAQRLHRLQLDGTRVVRDEFLLHQLGERIRDVRQGPDGWLYLLTDSPDGRLLRLTPAS